MPKVVFFLASKLLGISLQDTLQQFRMLLVEVLLDMELRQRF